VVIVHFESGYFLKKVGYMRLLKGSFAAIIATLLLVLATLAPIAPVSAASVTTTLNVTSGPPGTQVAIIGGFTPNAFFTVSYGTSTTLITSGTTIITGTVSTGGTVAPFAVPVLPRGAYNIMVTAGPDYSVTPYPTFTVTPQITVSAATGAPGDQVNVSGNGFNASQTVSIVFDNQAVSSVSSDVHGVIPSTAVTIPSAALGDHTISAKDAGGSTPTAAFSITPKLTLSVLEGQAGTVVSISGVGFSASKAVSFFIDTTSVTQTVTTDTAGKFANYNLTIPALPGGNHVIKVQDFGYTGAITANFKVNPSITLQPNQGAIGSKVTITGNGFTPVTDNPITITYNDTAVTTTPAAISADGDGNFSATIQVPSGVTGAVKIIAKDKLTTASADFTSIANILVSPATGIVGTTVTVTGSGLNATTAITVNYDGAAVVTVKTDTDGKFSTSFKVPESGTGTHQITVSDQVSTFKYDFKPTADAKIDSTSGYVGKDITASGTGFTAAGNVVVKYDTAQIATVTADAQGTFTVTFKAPASNGGAHQIIITDGVSSFTKDFSMDSTAPSAPTLISPKTATKAAKSPNFTWQTVNDPSGVTYSLQVSRDTAFAIVLLQKDDLKTPGYQLTSQEVLANVGKDAPYYWRVKAIDGANNASGWSNASTFFVGTIIPTSTYIVIVIVVCIAVGGLAYLIEKLRNR
jgi:hypothetical protein